MFYLSRLQASLHVRARVLPPPCAASAASRALDAPLGRRGLPRPPGACYSAHRCLPRRDFHPLETRSAQIPPPTPGPPLLHDAPPPHDPREGVQDNQTR